MVGTNWACVTCAADEREALLGVEVLHQHDGAAHALAVIDHTSGAEWYSGAGLR